MLIECKAGALTPKDTNEMECLMICVGSVETHVITSEMVYVDEFHEVAPLVEELKEKHPGFDVVVSRFMKEKRGGWEEVPASKYEIEITTNGVDNVENHFINQIELAKQSIEQSKQRIAEYKQGGDIAKPFLLKEEGYLKGLEQKLNALETLFFQYSQEAMQSWIDDTQDYLNGLYAKELI